MLPIFEITEHPLPHTDLDVKKQVQIEELKAAFARLKDVRFTQTDLGGVFYLKAYLRDTDAVERTDKEVFVRWMNDYAAVRKLPRESWMETPPEAGIVLKFLDRSFGCHPFMAGPSFFTFTLYNWDMTDEAPF